MSCATCSHWLCHHSPIQAAINGFCHTLTFVGFSIFPRLYRNKDGKLSGVISQRTIATLVKMGATETAQKPIQNALLLFSMQLLFMKRRSTIRAALLASESITYPWMETE